MLYNLVSEIIKYCPDICSKEMFCYDKINYFLDLTKNKGTKNEYELNDVTILLNNLETSHKQKCKEQSMDFDQTPNILFLISNVGMKLRLSKPIDFMGKKKLRCKAVITSTGSYFSSNDLWYQVGNEAITSLQDDAVSNVLMVSFEADSEDFYTNEESLIYKGKEHQRISNLGDRHIKPKKEVKIIVIKRRKKEEITAIETNE